MALRQRCCWLCWEAALGIWILMFAIEPNGAYASSRGLFRRKASTVIDTLTHPGICATAITVHGYTCQEFYVTTQDGFILNMQRIPQGRNGDPAGTNRPPVIVQHGLTSDARSWFINPPEQSLPTVLADNGFDVWLPNTRGTNYSRRHTTLDPSQKAFWDWSWDELVIYELPAIFDHVYKQTGQKIHYVGHSLGTLMGLVSCSERTIVDKLQSVASLCPIAYLSHMTTLFGNLAAKSLLSETLQFLGIAEFNLGGEAAKKLLIDVCAHPLINCNDLISAMIGKNCCLNSSSVEKFFESFPQSSSTKNMCHLAQTVRSGVLTKFDYGKPEDNMKHYGVAQPPAYNLSNIPNDLSLFIGYGGEDALADTRDVARLIDDLQFHDKDKLYIEYIDDYGHQDFVLAVNAKDKVFNSLISFLKLHTRI